MADKIILIAGYCATGKSAFSIKLGKELNIACYNKDTLKEVLADSIGGEHEDVIGKLSNTTFKTMIYIAEKMMASHNNFIMESNYKIREIERMKLLIEKYGYECLTYLFTGDLKVLHKRYIERDDIRHWVHLRGESDETDFINGQKQLGEIKIGKIINVDATDFNAVNYNSLIDTAKKFIL